MDTIKCLNENELSLLLYVVNHVDPMTPKMEIGIKELPWLRQDLLIKKLAAQEPKLNEEGKSALQGVIAKITRYSFHEAEEFRQQNESATKPIFSQPEFQFEKN